MNTAQGSQRVQRQVGGCNQEAHLGLQDDYLVARAGEKATPSKKRLGKDHLPAVKADNNKEKCFLESAEGDKNNSPRSGRGRATSSKFYAPHLHCFCGPENL